MVWVPAVSDEVANVATPEPLSATVPNGVPESLKVTFPDGIPALLDIVAVNVTEEPVFEGLAEELRTVVVTALTAFTTWVRDGDPLGENPLAPL